MEWRPGYRKVSWPLSFAVLAEWLMHRFCKADYVCSIHTDSTKRKIIMARASNEYMYVYMKQRRAERRQDCYVRLGNKCARCGITGVDFEFDHMDPSTKVMCISSMLDMPLDVLHAELIKCQLLCKECHIEKTNEENGSVQHGITGYSHHKCRCDICRAAWNENVRKYRLTHARKDYKKKEKFFGAAI